MSHTTLSTRLSKKYLLLVYPCIISMCLISLLSGYKSDIISNSELMSYKLFFINPESILNTYHHWLPNFIGALIIKFCRQYSIFSLRFLGLITILFICFILYKMMKIYFNRNLSILSVFFPLFFILKNYTIFNSSLITGLFYILFIYFVVQALDKSNDYLFFCAGICLSLNFFTDCQNILCLLCILGIFIYYKISKTPNSKQNKQFIPLLSGILTSSAAILLIIKASGNLPYYIDSVSNSYSLFENSIGIYSGLNMINSLKMFTYSYIYWTVFILVVLFISAKLSNFKNKKSILIISSLIISGLISYFINDNWQYIFIGTSYTIFLLYIANIEKCSNEFRLMCLLAFIMESLLGLGILRDIYSITYGLWIGLSLSFITSVNVIRHNLNITVSIHEDKNILPFKIELNNFYFIFISLFIIYILCSAKSFYNNISPLIADNSPLFSNENLIDSQYKSNYQEINKLTGFIKKYSSTSEFLLTQNDLNILYFTSDKAPLLGYTIYDDYTIPFDIQIKTNVKRVASYPIVVIRKDFAHDAYFSNATDFVHKNNYKSVYKSGIYELFVPSDY